MNSSPHLVGSLLLLLAACTSLTYQYHPSLKPSERSANQSVIAVTDFLDLREPLRLNLDHSDSDYYLELPRAKRGLTHNGQRSAPAALVLHDLFLAELANAGIKTLPLGAFEKKTAPEDLAAHAKTLGAEYVITGQVNAFSMVVKQPPKTNAQDAVLLNLLLRRRGKVTYSLDIKLSLIRVSDGKVLWSQGVRDEVLDRKHRTSKMQREMFSELLPPLLLKAAKGALGELEIDLEDRAKHPLLPTPK